MKKCPYCAEEIQDEAIFCRFCQHDLQVPAPTPTPPLPKNKYPPFVTLIICRYCGQFSPLAAAPCQSCGKDFWMPEDAEHYYYKEGGTLARALKFGFPPDKTLPSVAQKEPARQVASSMQSPSVAQQEPSPKVQSSASLEAQHALAREYMGGYGGIGTRKPSCLRIINIGIFAVLAVGALIETFSSGDLNFLWLAGLCGSIAIFLYWITPVTL